MIRKPRSRYDFFLQHHCQPPMAVAWASTRWTSHTTVRCSAKSTRGWGPSCILLCLLTHLHSRSQYICLVLYSCRDFSGFDARRVHSLHRNLPLIGRYLQIWWFGFWLFLHNSSIGLAHWCAHQSGPIRPIRSCFGVIFPFPFLSDSTANLYQFCLFSLLHVFCLALSLSLLPFSFFKARLCHISPLFTAVAHCCCRFAILFRVSPLSHSFQSHQVS